jgi:peptide/nickel transport system substrate-binding protein
VAATPGPHGRVPPLFGAEGWPKCLNPVLDCGDPVWFRATVSNLVLPRLTQWSNAMQLEPSPLIQEVPTLDNGGLTESPFTVTYHLNPKAVWSDGSAITCDDVVFTWDAILNTTGTYSIAGYAVAYGPSGPTRVECPDARTVKVDFNRIDVGWPEFFGGMSGFVLERAAFPSVDAVKPDLKDEMQQSILFSGGPFILKSWSKAQAVLVRNDAYWGKQPSLDEIMFVPRPGPATEATGLLTGDVAAIAPEATNLPFADQFGANPYVKAVGGDGNSVEALWFQLDDPVMRKPLVRQAFAFAMDRDAATKGVAALNDPAAKTNDCGPWIPGQGPWCPATGPFARYAYDPAKADELLTQAGYDCSKVAAGGFCTKHGKPLTVTISASAGDVQEATTVAILEQQALAAGIDIQLRTYTRPGLFFNALPKGDFQVALYSTPPVVDPSVSGLFSCDQIPTPANGYGGGNWDHWCDESASRVMEASDQQLDPAVRASEIQQVGSLLARDLPMLPLFALPNVAAWRTDEIEGVDPSSVSSPYGFFFDVSSWHFAS